MYRVLAALGGSLVLAACSSTPDWMPSMNLDALKPSPIMETVRFESEPSGAEAKVANQACRTPCALSLPADTPFTVNFALNGYQTTSERVEKVNMGDGAMALRPNPVMVELTPAPPAPKPSKPAPKKRTTAAKPATASTAARPASQPSGTPWPSPSQQ